MWASAVCARCLLLASLLGSAAAQAGPTVTVAAVQYADGRAATVDPACGDANCAVEVLVRRAAAAGAELVVTPEYALGQAGVEASPRVGEVPSTGLSARFATLADELDVYLVISLVTGAAERPYNSQVAFGPDGAVRAVHHKFELFDHENLTMRAGTDVTAFDTPFGRVGLLVCADIYGDPRLHARLTEELGATIVALSERWTVAGAPRWAAAFARDWGVTVVAANGSGGEGRGGGVFGADGRTLAAGEGAAVVLADVPRPP